MAFDEQEFERRVLHVLAKMQSTSNEAGAALDNMHRQTDAYNMSYDEAQKYWIPRLFILFMLLLMIGWSAPITKNIFIPIGCIGLTVLTFWSCAVLAVKAGIQF